MNWPGFVTCIIGFTSLILVSYVEPSGTSLVLAMFFLLGIISLVGQHFTDDEDRLMGEAEEQ